MTVKARAVRESPTADTFSHAEVARVSRAVLVVSCKWTMDDAMAALAVAAAAEASFSAASHYVFRTVRC